VIDFDFGLFLGDIHLPYEHKDYLEFSSACWAKYSKPYDKKRKLVFSVGDITDQHPFSPKYKPHPDGMSQKEEIISVRAKIMEWGRIFPYILICEGNHDGRFLNGKMTTLAIRDIRDVFMFPDGWQYQESYDVTSGGIFIHTRHGEGRGGLFPHLAIAKDLLCCVVTGHCHTVGGVAYHRGAGPGNLIWGAATGCGVDQEEYAFVYSHKQTKKFMLGLVIVEMGVPRFIPMFLDKNDRWIRRIP
jgi:hypothetical protein